MNKSVASVYYSNYLFIILRTCTSYCG